MAVGQPDPLADRQGQAVAAFQEGDAARCVERAEAVHGEALQAGRSALAADAALLLSRAHFNYFDASSAARWVDETVRCSQVAGLPYVEAWAWAIGASLHAMDDHPDLALAGLERAAALIDDRIGAGDRCSILSSVGVCYHSMGMSVQAMKTFRQAVDLTAPDEPAAKKLLRLVNLLHSAANAFDQLVHADRGKATALVESVLPDVTALEQLARGLGTPYAWASYCLYAGGVMRRLGRLQEASELLDPRHWAATPLADWVRRERLLDLALLQRDLGELDAAATTARAVRALAHQGARHGNRALDLLHDSVLAELLGEPQQALALFRRHHAIVLRNEHAAFDARLAELTATVSAQALRLENTALRQHTEGMVSTFRLLSDLAMTDSLTGVANRRALEGAYAAALSAGRRIGLLLLDLDHFKQVNDHCSHLVGDQVLRQAARLMSQGLREQDLLGRYGGEEFAALLADVDLEQAMAVAERLRECVDGFDWSPRVGHLPVTVSGGLVAVQPAEPFEQAVSRADRLLYGAKQAGRNRVLSEGLARQPEALD